MSKPKMKEVDNKVIVKDSHNVTLRVGQKWLAPENTIVEIIANADNVVHFSFREGEMTYHGANDETYFLENFKLIEEI